MPPEAIDCSGVCWPGPPGLGVDAALARAAKGRSIWAERALRDPGAKARGFPARAIGATFADRLRDIEGLSAASPVIDLEQPASAAVCQGIFVGSTASPVAIFDDSAFSNGPLYLPRLHALLVDGGATPVAVLNEPGRTNVTWSDGTSITIPTGWARLPDGWDHPRLIGLEWAGGVRVLNGVPAVAQTSTTFDPLERNGTDEAIAIFEDGLELLELVWPAAADAARRHLQGLLFLELRDHTRSHSPAERLGLVLMTARDPVSVGDLLCHELSHVRMNAMRREAPLFELIEPSGPEERFVSPWRPDLRPLNGLVDGVHAFLNVHAFYARLGKRSVEFRAVAADVCGRQREKIRSAWADVARHAVPSGGGIAIARELGAGVAAL